jgi:hypothetical protein
MAISAKCTVVGRLYYHYIRANLHEEMAFLPWPLGVYFLRQRENLLRLTLWFNALKIIVKLLVN